MKTESLVSWMDSIVGLSVAKPSKQLAGHAAGLPFEKLVHDKLIEHLGNKALRHFEFLNDVLLRGKEVDRNHRMALFGPSSIQKLLCRNPGPMAKWSPTEPFGEKQSDTAETIILEKEPYNPKKTFLRLIDVKTVNEQKKGQAPNIISAEKLAKVLVEALREGQVRFDIIYVAISWTAQGNRLVAKSVKVISLFKMQPNTYINWTAAQQIQFHPLKAEQDFSGSREEWAQGYLKHFLASLQNRNARQLTRAANFKKQVDQVTKNLVTDRKTLG